MRILLTLVFFFISIAASAWNGRGHMIVAAIAYQELTKEKQESITDILIHHPEYKRKWKADYQVVKNEAELGLYLFMRASVWPDNIKSNKHPDHKYNAPRWHYMNYELRFPYSGELKVMDDYNVLQAIKVNLNTFYDHDTPLDQKAIALSWLIHLVGDIHQPLHTSSLFSDQFPKGDRGGNLFWIKANGAVKLHSYWDGLMGRSTKVRDVLNEANLIKSTDTKGTPTVEMNPAIWSQESFKLARKKVYLDGELQGSSDKENALSVPENYGKESKKVGEQQVSLAGYRLASLVGHTYRSKSLTLFHCSDVEADQDIIRSVNNIKNQLSNSQIIWKEEKDDKCGYLLKFGEREKLIEGAMTDVDLWMELKDFFEL